MTQAERGRRPRLAAENLHVGLVGAGGMGETHLDAWLELGAEVTIFSDDGRGQVLAAADETGRLAAVTTLDELIERCDVVDICTPTFTHKDIAVTAANAGRHVVCEKPLALTVEGAAEIIAAASLTGVDVFPAHVVRYFPEYEVMIRAVASGAIGTPAVVRLNRTGRYPTQAAWYSDPERSGGILLDQMIHDFDIARLIAGEVVAVHAVVRSEVVAPAQPGAVAAATAILTHASGALTHVRGVWGPPSTPFQTSFRVAGRGGVLEHDTTRTEAFRVVGRSHQSSYLPGVGLTESPYLRELREFAVAFTGGPRPRVSAEDGLVAIRIASAAQRSAATGEPIEVRNEEVAP